MSVIRVKNGSLLSKSGNIVKKNCLISIKITYSNWDKFSYCMDGFSAFLNYYSPDDTWFLGYAGDNRCQGGGPFHTIYSSGLFMGGRCCVDYECSGGGGRIYTRANFDMVDYNVLISWDEAYRTVKVPEEGTYSCEGGNPCIDGYPSQSAAWADFGYSNGLVTVERIFEDDL